MPVAGGPVGEAARAGGCAVHRMLAHPHTMIMPHLPPPPTPPSPLQVLLTPYEVTHLHITHCVALADHCQVCPQVEALHVLAPLEGVGRVCTAPATTLASSPLPHCHQPRPPASTPTTLSTPFPPLLALPTPYHHLPCSAVLGPSCFHAAPKVDESETQPIASARPVCRAAHCGWALGQLGSLALKYRSLLPPRGGCDTQAVGLTSRRTQSALVLCLRTPVLGFGYRLSLAHRCQRSTCSLTPSAPGAAH